MEPSQLLELLHVISQPARTKDETLAQERLCAARTRCLEAQLLVQEVEGLSTSDTIDSSQAACLHQALQVARATQMLSLPDCAPDDAPHSTSNGAMPSSRPEPMDLSGGSTQTYLGVLPDNLLAQQQRHQLEQVQCMQQVLPHLERSLASQVTSLAAALHSAPQAPTSMSSRIGGATDEKELVSIVPARREQVARHNAAMLSALTRQLGTAVEMLQLLSLLSADLQGFAREHILDRQQALDQFWVELATQHCRSLCHKLQVVELQIESSVYTQESIAALSKVREHLASRLAAVNAALKDVKSSLQAYADLGPSFQKVKNRYLAVQSELVSVQQSLATFAELEQELTRTQ